MASAEEKIYVNPISSSTLRGVSASYGGKIWDSSKWTLSTEWCCTWVSMEDAELKKKAEKTWKHGSTAVCKHGISCTFHRAVN